MGQVVPKIFNIPDIYSVFKYTAFFYSYFLKHSVKNLSFKKQRFHRWELNVIFIIICTLFGFSNINTPFENILETLDVKILNKVMYTCIEIVQNTLV